ncbi:MAG: chemotaxis protein CheW [Spirochaetota bacterium]|nr:chemotaxis protein CheW [Spirochaetota bacterium]
MEVATKTNQLVTFELEDDVFGIDIMLTQEILKYHHLRKIPNTPYYFEGMLNLRGTIIPVINFKRLFSFGTFDLTRDKGIIIVRLGEEKFGIVIDRILRVLALENMGLKPVPAGFSNALKQYMTGVVDDGKVFIGVLDVLSIFKATSQELTLGGEEGQHNLDFRRDKLSLLSTDDEKIIANFLESINFKTNIVTNVGIRNYFSRYKIRTKKSMEIITRKIKELIEFKMYNPFSQTVSKAFYENEEDFITLLSVLEQLVAPLKTKSGELKLKIVNVNCGAGHDIYSILIMLKAFMSKFDKWTIKFIGVSDNLKALTIAKEGLYTREELKRINSKDLSSFFVLEDGKYRLKNELRNMVDFRFGTAKNFEPMVGVDLFFCRGMFSTMEEDIIKRQITSFSEALIPNGIILLSEIEDLYDIECPDLSAREINGHRYYVRI